MAEELGQKFCQDVKDLKTIKIRTNLEILTSDSDSAGQNTEELVFYNDDESFQSVVVEKNLCASDLCQLLAMKNRVAKSVHWSIVEYWVDLGLVLIDETLQPVSLDGTDN
ncbi:hypothetical protein NQ318_001357 [Aromia moschata]|uniref:Uncharacterized protein n=1 Tax=Aromia moschata TaxID=1265417 RepID=A0AAV8YU47_9CUCU|nr:hypothetical protein NQ318_001357 [Aromia moschata]